MFKIRETCTDHENNALGLVQSHHSVVILICQLSLQIILLFSSQTARTVILISQNHSICNQTHPRSNVPTSVIGIQR